MPFTILTTPFRKRTIIEIIRGVGKGVCEGFMRTWNSLLIRNENHDPSTEDYIDAFFYSYGK